MVQRKGIQCISIGVIITHSFLLVAEKNISYDRIGNRFDENKEECRYVRELEKTKKR